jgi:putative NADPH-quinone reductase
MRLLVVFSHPVAASFGRAVYDRLAATLAQAGHEVRGLDLYAEGFDPVLSEADRLDYHTPGRNEARVLDQIAHIRWAEGLIFVYPTWWYSLPAMLKGWIDRVWVPFVTFDLPDGLQPIRGRMGNIRLVGGISTYGSPWWWTRFVIGDPGRRIIMRGLRPLCHRRCRTFWLGHYRMDSSTPASRQRFLERVERLAAGLPG